MPKALKLLLASALVGIVVAALPSASSASGPRLIFDEEGEDCLELLPDGTAVQQQSGRIALDMLVLLDGVSVTRGQEVMTQTVAAYNPLDVDLKWEFRIVSLPGPASGEIDPQKVIDASKKEIGGRRPDGIDVVYTLTSKDFTEYTAGMADCIGGVRYPSFAFAVGMDIQDGDLAAKVVGHEIGHLLGAHHHYFNCVQGLLSDSPNFCTLMSPDVGLASINFGALEGMVVRGHAEDFARP